MVERTESELEALINLLDDEQVYPGVRNRLLEYGSDAVPHLRGVIEDRDESRVTRAAEVLREIHQQTFEEKWVQTLRKYTNQDLDLEEMTWLIARIAYPAVDVEFYQSQLDEIANHTRSRIQEHDSGIVRIRRLVGVIANTLGYTGNTANYYEVDNSYLNRVIDRKVGIPITLSVLYLLVAKRVGLPLAGVNIPGHFMVKYVGTDHTAAEPFIDPFFAGRMLGRLAAQRFCLRIGVGFREYYLEPATNTAIIERMLRNLVILYSRTEDADKMHQMRSLLHLYSKNYTKPGDQ